MNQGLQRLAHKLMQDGRNATRRTNYGGWHYAFDLFELQNEVLTEFRNQMELHVQAFLNHFRPQERKNKDHFRLRGWINVNRPGWLEHRVERFEGSGERISIAFNVSNP